MPALKVIPAKHYEALGLSRFPNFHATDSIKGMKNSTYGHDALLVRCGQWIYNVSSSPDIYNDYNLVLTKSMHPHDIDVIRRIFNGNRLLQFALKNSDPNVMNNAIQKLSSLTGYKPQFIAIHFDVITHL